ncbi:MAG: hypothetical protein HC893_05560 [Chloroflexaceae bacterium]|nr:hypothetical protein [Chloroflexaceae bacterium]
MAVVVGARFVQHSGWVADSGSNLLGLLPVPVQCRQHVALDALRTAVDRRGFIN